MKNFLLTLLCLTCITKSYGDVAKSYGDIVVEITNEKGNISTKVEVKSAFYVEDSSWVQSIEKNITKSIRVGKRVKKGKYIVTVKFILTKDGTLSDILCKNDPGFGMCDKVVSAIKKSQKWHRFL